MELLSPAGNLEKLRIAYRYGADAAYIGVREFSLRSAADTIISPSEADDEATVETLHRLKQTDNRPRRLYAALNLFAQQEDLKRLPEVLKRLAHFPIDALIIADIGLVEMVRRYLPDMELHLSTQANCTNSEAARLYHRIGFSRIVAARELTLPEISEIRNAVPEVELEVFVHGAMCMSYSGRCFLSSEMTGRSANRGDCAHSCRWRYALNEEKRPGEYYPIEEDGRFSTILSSRDLMLYDHIEKLRDAGVTAAKIEGRMKSSLYTAIATAAYRRTLDGGHDDTWRNLLFDLPHRSYTTGFLLGDETVHRPAKDTPSAHIRLMGILGPPDPDGPSLDARNTIYIGDALTALLPDGTVQTVTVTELYDQDGSSTERAIQGVPAAARFEPPLPAPAVQDGILVKYVLAPNRGR
ncbi:MAG: U32 family peptidase [Alkalispirochaeta sp.]